MGDTVAQELLARSIDSSLPLAISSVTLLNGGVLVERTRPIAAQRIGRTAVGGVVLPRLPRALARRLFDRSLASIAGRPPTREELDGQFALSERAGGRRVLPHTIQYMRERELHRARWRRGLLEHAIAMQLVWGDRDPINPFSTVEYIVSQRPATRAVRIAGAGHYPQVEAPEAVAEAITSFE